MDTSQVEANGDADAPPKKKKKKKVRQQINIYLKFDFGAAPQLNIYFSILI